MVVGFLGREGDGAILYLHKEDFENQIYKNGVWISRNTQVLDQTKKLDKIYVQVAGIFTTKHKGELGVTSGAIESVKLIVPYSCFRPVEK